jgi:glycosyltransferase involved in cell wall biosynthesis
MLHLDDGSLDEIKDKIFDGISVVVPTYNYRDNLRRTLDSLCQQQFAADRFEVIVADDGSTDGTEQLVASYQQLLNIRYIYQEDAGFRVSKARNLGASLARFHLLLFFDAGMIAAPDMLSRHYQRHQQHADLALIGLSYGVNEFSLDYPELLLQLVDAFSLTDLFQQLPRYPALADCRYNYLQSLQFELAALRYPWVVFWTGHVSCRTRVFRQLGGFDEWFQSWGGEDVEFGIRLFQHGSRFELLPEQWSLHYPHFKDPAKKQKDARGNIEYICQKHADPGVALLRQHSWLEIARLLATQPAELQCS